MSIQPIIAATSLVFTDTTGRLVWVNFDAVYLITCTDECVTVIDRTDRFPREYKIDAESAKGIRARLTAHARFMFMDRNDNER